MDERPTYIYVLCEPDGETVRYVGKSVNPVERLRHHLRPSNLRSHTYKNNWINRLLAACETPVMKIIDEVPASGDWEAIEAYWIHHYRSTGCVLTNATDGGEGQSQGYRASDESKRRQSEAQRGRRLSDETKAKISASNLGKKRPPRTLTPEHRASIAESMRGNTNGYGQRRHEATEQAS